MSHIFLTAVCSSCTQVATATSAGRNLQQLPQTTFGVARAMTSATICEAGEISAMLSLRDRGTQFVCAIEHGDQRANLWVKNIASTERVRMCRVNSITFRSVTFAVSFAVGRV